MTDKSFIAMAIEQERASYDFYDQWSKRINSPAAKQVLLELRDFELGHVYDLINLETLTENHELPEPDILAYSEIDYRPICVESSLNDILLIALRMEAKSYETYSRYASKFKDNSYNLSFFIHLAEEEKKHISIIKTLISESINYTINSVL